MYSFTSARHAGLFFSASLSVSSPDHTSNHVALTFLFLGPYGAGIFDPRSWGSDTTTEDTVNEITLEFTRVVLAIGVFAIGVELPKAYMKRHWKSLLYLLFPVMTWVGDVLNMPLTHSLTITRVGLCRQA